MANPNTAADWQSAIDNLDTIKKATVGQLAGSTARLASLELQLQTAQAAKARADFQGEDLAGYQSQIDSINRSIAGQKVQISNLTRDIAQTDAEINNAFNQKFLAESGPPNTNENTPPANPEPGSNTAAEPPQDFGPVNVGDPTTDEFDGVDNQVAANENALQEPQPLTQEEIDQYIQQGGEIDLNAALEEPPNDDSNADEFDGIDQQVAANENALQEPPVLTDEEANQYIQQGGEQEIDLNAPLEEPPLDESNADEFDGIDQQVAANENALQEPPVLSDEEVDQYLQNAGRDGEEQIENPSPQESFRQSELRAQSAEARNQTNFGSKPDWRVRLSLAPSANYLYAAPDPGPLLKPLAATQGVIFPYTPQIGVQYAAHYDSTDIAHSNYKIFSYKSSSVDNISINCQFTAQDTNEANYLLAVIHFFRSVTKMFYGQDKDPVNGIPPPLCYLSGLGTFQFDSHPLVITNFNYSLPDDVDYIRAGLSTSIAGTGVQAYNPPDNVNNATLSRTRSSNVPIGGVRPAPSFQANNISEPTYVPTRMQIQISCLPIVTRNDISTNFSVKEYAAGRLLRGSIRRGGGGIW